MVQEVEEQQPNESVVSHQETGQVRVLEFKVYNRKPKILFRQHLTVGLGLQNKVRTL